MNKILPKLQAKMKEAGIDFYLIPSEDSHQSEYVDDYFKCRQYISEFTGSAGTLLVTVDSCYLWTDGRYFTQAEQQIDTKQITLMKSGVAGVPTISEYLSAHLKNNQTLGVNGTTISTTYGKQLNHIVDSKNGIFKTDLTLVEDLWDNRPARNATPIYIHKEIYTGESVDSKLKTLREKLTAIPIEGIFIAALPDIAWLLNLRAADLACTPLFYSYCFVSTTECILFVNLESLTTEAKEYLQESNITIQPYEYAKDFLKHQSGSILLDPDSVNYHLYMQLTGKKVALGTNPTVELKAIRNEVQIENLKKCHLYDGIAVTKFMYWLKNNIGKIPMDELSVSEHLEQERKKLPHYMGPSFDTICAYKEHGAMMHYLSTPKTNIPLKNEGLLLIDSGGQYFTGTTDITRTFVLGEISKEEKKNFTLVCKSMLNLANAKFLLGCRGSNLDILARQALWNEGIDYRCGTGHGVGYFLGVHEGPNAFRWQTKADRLDAILRPGMVTTDEPGVYVPGKYGIRTENMLLCKKQRQNEYGAFLEFEHLTLVPIDLDGIDDTLLTENEKNQLADYHQLVFDSLSPYLEPEEVTWLKEFLSK